MARYVAFLRGINVGGHKATKDQLCEAFEAVDHAQVSTFRASGNVIFESPERRSAKMTAAIEDSLEQVLGYAVPTFVRTKKEIEAIAKQKPFGARKGGKLQVTFLDKKPTAAIQRKLLALELPDDPLKLIATELYWLPKAGQLDSRLDLKEIDRLTGPNTRRTMGTVELIAAKL